MEIAELRSVPSKLSVCTKEGNNRATSDHAEIKVFKMCNEGFREGSFRQTE